jgi:hypothetical protein
MFLLNFQVTMTCFSLFFRSPWLVALIFFLSLQMYCDLPQMHLLSVKMGPNLHRGCPTNCQDILTWLPTSLAHKIMSYFDPGLSELYNLYTFFCLYAMIDWIRRSMCQFFSSLDPLYHHLGAVMVKIYNYLCNQCLSPLTLWVWIPLMAMCTRYNIMW